MLYNLSNRIDAEKFKTRVNALFKNKKVVELKEKKPQRSLNQNNYLHLILAHFACEYGERLEWVKQRYYKELVNPEIFKVEKHDKLIGRTFELRSSSTLTTEEMSLSIERFKNWSSEQGILLPDAEDKEFLLHIQQQIEIHKQYL